MLISMNWIGEFVDLSGLDLDALISKFTLATAEVEEIYHKGEDVIGVVAAKILSVENHPKSKKLHLLKVDAGDKVYDVVCGAPNVEVGIIVPFVPMGGSVGGMDIKEAEIAGYKSYGMCCSESELGISDDHSGLMILPEDTKLGTSIKDLYPIDDIVFEVDNKSLTNRPDLWGHYGIAREFAAITKRPLKPVDKVNHEDYANLPEVEIDIQDTEHCYRYIGTKAENVTRKVSPVDMRIRLFYCGSRAINFLADITNYIMLELGQPMHAFDMRQVNKVEVKRFDNKFKFETLDQVERDIDENTLMICSNDEPVAIAGIMGGYKSEINDDTTTLLLESANFDGVCVRKSTSRMGHRKDASMRYEKMLDPELCMVAAERYVKLLLDLDEGAKITSAMTDSYPVKYPEISLNFDKRYVDRYTGIEITNDEIVETLKALGFKVSLENDNFSVVVPSWRSTKDVTIKADIIEEITRIYGYDNFVIKTTNSPLAPVRDLPSRNDDYMVKSLLADKFGLHEIHTYIWNDAKKQKEIGITAEGDIRLINSISPDNIIIRKSLIPNELTVINENKTFKPTFGIFEIARVVDGKKENGYANEKKMLGITLFSREKSEEELYLAVKDIVKTIGITTKNYNFTLKNADSVDLSWQHPVNTAEIYMGDTKIGYFTALHPEIKDKIDKKAAIICAELDMDCIYSIEQSYIKYVQPSKFPGIEIDLSFLLDKNAKFEVISKVIDNFECPFIQGYKLADVFESEALNDKKSVTVRIDFCSFDRTLSGEEIQEYVNSLIEKFAETGINLKV